MKIAFAGFRHNHIMSLYNIALQNKEVSITGCCEEDAEARESAEKKYGLQFKYKSFADVLNDEEAEVIAIGDYYQKRGSMVIAALKRGKHVMCDKPICTELSELYEIQKLSLEKDLKVGCMLELRYMPQIRKVKEIIESGEIGCIKNASFSGQHCLDYENRPKWYFEEGKHGGTINDIGIHGIDLLRFITGKNMTNIYYARTWNAFADKAPKFRDCGQFCVAMENMTVMADVSYAAPLCKEILPTYWEFHLWGTNGMIRFNWKDGNIIHLYRSTEEVIECECCKNNYLDDFIEEVRGKQTIMNTQDILQSQMQILELQKRSDL